MSLLEDFDHVDLYNFVGANLLNQEEDVTAPECLANKNCMFNQNIVQTRNGFGQAFNPNKGIRSLYNWLQQQYNRLMYLNSDNEVIGKDLAGIIADATVLTGVAAAGMFWVEAGYRLYMGFFDSTGYGYSQGKVWDGTFITSTPAVDVLFQGTLRTTQLSGGASWGTFVASGSGSVTAGTHGFALVPTTYNGFQTAPGPIDSFLVFTPRLITTPAGQILTVTVTPSSTWPDWVDTVQLAMTTANNQNRWYLVPSDFGGGPLVVGRGSGIAAIFTIDIDDVTLAGGGSTEITNTLFDLFTTDTLTVFPHCIFSCNNRNIYLTRTNGPGGVGTLVANLMISEQYQVQQVFTRTNILNLPEFKDALWGFALSSKIYVGGPSWTYEYQDNLQSPTQWAAAREVSGAIGSPFIQGVSVNQDKGYAWVGDRTGLYYYVGGGNYPVLPASWEQTPDWDRINFAANQNSFSILEIPGLRCVVVMAALDGATQATHFLVWDYTYGVTPDKIKYCGLWNVQDLDFIGAMAVVQSYPDKIKEFWISHYGSTGDVKRLKSVAAGDATDSSPSALYDDETLGIDSSYRVLTVAHAAEGPQQQGGCSLRVRGAGQINVNAYDFDGISPIPLAPILASENNMRPGQRFLRMADIQSEVGIYEVNNGAAPGAFFILSAIRSYFKPWIDQR